MKTMLQVILPSLLLLSMAACKKETIDIHSGACFGISELLNSKNVQVKCGQTADFEGLSLCLAGVLEPSPESGKFFLLDQDHDSQWITVSLDSTISAAVQQFVQSNEGKTATVRGVLSGFDKPQNFQCVRGFEQHLSSITDIALE